MIGRKSNRSIARDIDVFEFLIRQIVQEDICYFSYKMRNGYFFLSLAIKDNRKDCAANLLNKLKYPLQLNML